MVLRREAVGKARKKDTALPQKSGKKKEAQAQSIEKKSKWQEFLDRHSTDKRLEEKS